ncbi:hypothetical protein KIN20_013913 [Parelaphostrongylus tenuis]|uniref:SCP domain-containing protein n=1 Tax=Parelaphostrongylus tenuis TaxID=148309 RepID=A0AAD5MHI4_PARTN|nr:hypothetical protein KIN20_013913 [Parelaphostrongylus tenuis]
MYSLIALLILVTVLHVTISEENSRDFECSVKGSKMTEDDRRTVTKRHNEWRRDLAKGEDSRRYPKAQDMRYMKYNCTLEEDALTIAKTNCEYASLPKSSFDFVGSNNHTVTRGRHIGGRTIINYGRVVQTWMETGEIYSSTHGLKPSKHDNKEIPFLQVDYYIFFS